MGNVLSTQKQIFHLQLYKIIGTKEVEFDYISFLGIILIEV